MKKRDELSKDTPEVPEGGLSRRRFMGAAALAGVAGATGLGSTIMSREAFAAAAKEAKNKIHIEPGELDEYYGFWSGGHQGEVRVMGVPSMRELMRIPVFNVDSATGWGITNESKDILGRDKTYLNGDCHHPHVSMTDGRYDGKYLFINDKEIGRASCRERVRVSGGG